MTPVIRSVLVLAGRRRVLLLAVAFLAVLVIAKIYSLSGDTDSSFYRFKWTSPVSAPSETRPALALPPEYDEFLAEQAAPQSQFCDERFTPRYLDDFRTHAIQYCAPGSPASLQCFQGHSRGKDVDSLCIGQGATLDLARRKFVLGCQLRSPDANETSRGLIPFNGIRLEWYETGPRWIFDNYVKVEPEPSGAAAALSAGTARQSRPQFALLVKREGSNNIWHCMMEIWSMMMTFDLLRTSPDPSRDGAALFADEPDLPNTQAIVFDDHPDGPVLDLWTIFTGRPLVRWNDLLADAEQARAFAENPRKLIIPLAGAANPLWQNDWIDRNCGHAPMLKTFVHRVLRFYGVSTDNHPKDEEGRPADGSPRRINLTFIDRTGSRKLLGHGELLAAVAARHPHVQIRSVDFATISFAEQLRLVRETDVLLGVHGAGLTHTMFMRDGRGAVVELRPVTNDYRGFKNLAFMKGLHYFTTQAEQVRSGDGNNEDGEEQERRRSGEEGNGMLLPKRESWHWDDVRIDMDTFMELMDAAIASVSDPGSGV